jgi:hypothetical protein
MKERRSLRQNLKTRESGKSGRARRAGSGIEFTSIRKNPGV